MKTEKNSGRWGKAGLKNSISLEERGRDVAHRPEDTLALDRAVKQALQHPGSSCMAPVGKVKGIIWVNFVILSSKE